MDSRKYIICCRASGWGFGVWGFGFPVLGLTLRFRCLGFRVSVFGVSGFWFGLKVLVFSVSGFGFDLRVPATWGSPWCIHGVPLGCPWGVKIRTCVYKSVFLCTAVAKVFFLSWGVSLRVP